MFPGHKLCQFLLRSHMLDWPIIPTPTTPYCCLYHCPIPFSREQLPALLQALRLLSQPQAEQASVFPLQSSSESAQYARMTGLWPVPAPPIPTCLIILRSRPERSLLPLVNAGALPYREQGNCFMHGGCLEVGTIFFSPLNLTNTGTVGNSKATGGSQTSF